MIMREDDEEKKTKNPGREECKKATNPITCQIGHPRGKAQVHFHLSSGDPWIPQVGAAASEAVGCRHAERLRPSDHPCRPGNAAPSSSR